MRMGQKVVTQAKKQVQKKGQILILLGSHQATAPNRGSGNHLEWGKTEQNWEKPSPAGDGGRYVKSWKKHKQKSNTQDVGACTRVTRGRKKQSDSRCGAKRPWDRETKSPHIKGADKQHMLNKQCPNPTAGEKNSNWGENIPPKARNKTIKRGCGKNMLSGENQDRGGAGKKIIQVQTIKKRGKVESTFLGFCWKPGRATVKESQLVGVKKLLRWGKHFQSKRKGCWVAFWMGPSRLKG